MHKIELIILCLVNLAKMSDSDPTSIKFKSALRVLISPMYLKVVWSDTYFDTSLAETKKVPIWPLELSILTMRKRRKFVVFVKSRQEQLSLMIMILIIMMIYDII